MDQFWTQDQVVTPQGASGPNPPPGMKLVPLTAPDPSKPVELQGKQLDNEGQALTNEGKRIDLQIKQAEAASKPDPALKKAITGLGLDELLTSVGRAREQIKTGWATGIPGQIAGMIPGTPRKDFLGVLDGLKGGITLEKLQALREQSATGSSGMGQLSEQEGERLAASVAALRDDMSRDELEKSLDIIERHAKSLQAIANGEDPNDKGVQKKYGIAPLPGQETAGGQPGDRTESLADKLAIEKITPEQTKQWQQYMSGVQQGQATPEQLDTAWRAITGRPMVNAKEYSDYYNKTGQVPLGVSYTKPDISDVRGDGGVAESLDAGVRNAADTATAGLASVASAAVDSALTDRTFKESLNRESAISDYDWQHHAISSTVGTVGGALLVPTRVSFAARAAARAALRSGATREAAVAAARKAAAIRLSKEGAVYGGVHGAATSRGDVADAAAQSAVEALTGAAVGATLPYVAQAGGAVAKAGKSVLGRTPDLANRIVFKTIKADGNSADDLARQASEAQANGVPYMLADSGENARGMLSASARAPGPGRTNAISALDDRQGALGDRVVSHIERDLGPVANPHKVADTLMTQASEAAGPLYDAAYSRAGADAFGRKIAPLLERPSMKRAYAKAYRIAQEEGRDPTTLGFDINEAGEVTLKRVPSWQTLDYVKRGMDDVVEGYRDPTSGRLNLDTEGRAINNTLRQFLKEFDAANPDYAAARAAYGGPVSGINAMNDGRKALNMTADDLEERMRGMTDFQKEMFALGARRAMAELVEGKGDTANVVHALVGTGKKRAMLARLFGDRESFDRFVKTLDIENEAYQTFKRARTGSPTAPNQQDDSALAVATGVADLATSGVPIMSALRLAARAKGGAQAKKAQEAVASMLGETDPARVKAIIAKFRKEEAGLAARRKRHSLAVPLAVKAVPNSDQK